MSGSPEHVYRSRGSLIREHNQAGSNPYNTLESINQTEIKKLFDGLRSKLPDKVKESITVTFTPRSERSLTRRDAVRKKKKSEIKFITWDDINESDKEIIKATAEEILSSEEKGYVGNLNDFLEKEWPLISDPKRFNQIDSDDASPIPLMPFKHDEFQRRHGARLGRQRTLTPSTSHLASGKRTRGKKPPANKKKKKRKYFSKKKRKSKTKK